jgi:DNA-binding MarR family transcriptional regulator
VSRTDGRSPELSSRLAYLLKHAQLRLSELTAEALASHSVDGRELGVLLVLADGGPKSQQQAAQRLGIDRTTMVAMLDALEGKGLVSRHPDVDDRRRNVVELTDAGQDALRRAVEASDAAEHEFLALLSAQDARQLRASLRTIVTHQGGENP